MSIHAGVRAHRFMIGSIACAIVSDGSFSYPDPAKLLFANANGAARTAQLRGHGINPDTWNEYVSPYSALLIETGHQKVLVDTGAGDSRRRMAN
jgi:hypothetical protein